MRLAAFVLLALVCSCTSTTPHTTVLDPGITDRGLCLAVAPIDVPPDLEDLRAAASLNQTLVRALEAAGYEVIAPPVMEPLIDRALDEAGNLYDPVSGEPRREAIRAAYTSAAREAESLYGADVLVQPSLERRFASCSGSTASWDGTWQPIEQPTRRLTRSNDDRFYRTTFYSGTIPALSLAVRMMRVTGRPAYEGFGGVHVMMTRTGPDYHDVPIEELLADEERNRAAVDLALLPLLP